MRALALLVIAASIWSADYESFRLKDGRTFDGEYVNGSIVLDGGQVSLPVKAEDIAYRQPADRPAKKDKPEKKPPAKPVAPPAPVADKDLSGTMTLSELLKAVEKVNASKDPDAYKRTSWACENFRCNWIHIANVDKFPGEGNDITELNNVISGWAGERKGGAYNSTNGKMAGHYNGGFENDIMSLARCAAYPDYVKARGEPKASVDNVPAP